MKQNHFTLRVLLFALCALSFALPSAWALGGSDITGDATVNVPISGSPLRRRSLRSTPIVIPFWRGFPYLREKSPRPWHCACLGPGI